MTGGSRQVIVNSTGIDRLPAATHRRPRSPAAARRRAPARRPAPEAPGARSRRTRPGPPRASRPPDGRAARLCDPAPRETELGRASLPAAGFDLACGSTPSSSLSSAQSPYMSLRDIVLSFMMSLTILHVNGFCASRQPAWATIAGSAPGEFAWRRNPIEGESLARGRASARG